MKMYGKIVEIGEVQEFGKNGFIKRTLEVEEVDSEGYEMMKNPDKLIIDATGTMVDYVSQRKVGDKVELGISFSVVLYEKEGKETRKFNNIKLYKILKMKDNVFDGIEE